MSDPVKADARMAEDIFNMWKDLSDKRPSIYRVPQHLRELNALAYTPCHVSIGPYHHRDHKYKVMEKHKLVYMEALIRRRGAPRHKEIQYEIKDYINAIEVLQSECEASYAEPLQLSGEAFVKMLLIDGCFIVEFLCRKIMKLSCVDKEPTRKVGDFSDMYAFIGSIYSTWTPSEDFIFQSTRTSFEVRRDLTLLENQLPYRVLEKIYEITFDGIGGKPEFHEIVYCALRTSIPNTTHILTSSQIKNSILEPKVPHFVSFLKRCCGISVNMEGSTSIKANSPRQITEFPCLCNMPAHEIRVPTATQLAKAGVRFERSSSNSSPLLEIKFKNGVLTMPSLIMWHHTETFFRNVMAYELYNYTTNCRSRSISDYMCFMDDLINSKEDVSLLVKKGIIQNWLESDDAVANLFNSITKHILADYESYSNTCRKLNEFRKTRNLRQLKVVLEQDYFNEPWAIIYFITGVIIQTTASVIQAVSSFRSTK